MPFEGFLTALAPVAGIGLAIYLFVQRWLCDPASERGLHWRGFVLKLASWPVYLAGTVLGVMRAEIPYIPTAKQAVRGRFVRLAWPQFVLVGVYCLTVARIVYTRLLITPEAALQLSAEAIWGMIAFATLPVLAAIGALYAAWEARRPAPVAPWDEVDIECVGGDV
jgi:cellulose synthase (UDP-forming)